MGEKLRVPTDGAVGAGIVLVLLPGIALFLFSYFDHITAFEVGLPVIAIFGIMILFGAMALVATLFKRLELSSPNEALALPSGSIRAVIALSLIVLFAIIAIMLFHSMAKPYVITGLSGDDKKAIVGNPANRVLAVVGRKCEEASTSAQPGGSQQQVPVPSKGAIPHPAGAPVQGAPAAPSQPGATSANAQTTGGSQQAAEASESSPAGPSKVFAVQQPAPNAPKGASGLQAPVSSNECYDVHLVQPPGQEAFDLAKQLLVLIGTLMTSVTSFYFATQATAKAVELGKPDQGAGPTGKPSDGKKPSPVGPPDNGKPPIGENQTTPHQAGGTGPTTSAPVTSGDKQSTPDTP